MTPEAAPQTAENPTDTPMHYDSERGMYVPGNNSGNIVNFNPNIAQNVGAPVEAPQPRRIDIIEAESTAETSPPPMPETVQTNEVESLRQRVQELEEQLSQERELREQLQKQHDEQVKVMKSLTKELREQNKLVRQLLEQNQPKPAEAEPQPEPTPEPAPEFEPPAEPEPTPEPTPEPEPTEPAIESGSPPAEDEGGGLRKRLRDIWNWAKNPGMWGAGSFNRIKNAGVGRDQEGRPIVAAVPGERPSEQPKTDEEKRKSRWWLVAIPLGALAAYGTYKAFQQGMDIPFFGDGNGGEVPEVPSSLDTANIANDTIYAKTPQEFVSGAFDLLGRQGIQAHGVTPEKVNALVDIMKENHWQIVSGMQNAPGGGLEWHTVDAAADWADGYTSNYRASAAQGFPGVGALRRFMETAASQGITFTRG